MTDELPADLDVSAYVGPYTFPDVIRRRIPAVMLGAIGAVLLALPQGVLVNRGFRWAGVGLILLGAYHWLAAYPLKVKELDALVAATKEVGFPVGHASAQVGFRGLRSRPTWRILLYSADEPPTQRGLVLVDAVTGDVQDHFVEANPEDWTELGIG